MKFKILLLVNLLTSIIFGQTWETKGYAPDNKIIYANGNVYTCPRYPYAISKINISNQEREIFYNEFASSFDEGVFDFEIDSSGNIWIATTNNGVYKFNGSSWYNFNSSNVKGMEDYIPKMKIIGDNVWLLGHYGFYYFNEDSVKQYTFASLGLSEAGQQQYFDVESDGTVWFSLFTEVYKYKNGELTKFDSNNSLLSGDYINGINAIAPGKVYIKDGENVVKYNNGEWSTYFEHTVDSPVSMELNIDNSEHAWTYYQGILYEYTGVTFNQYSDPNYDPMISGAHVSWSTTFDDRNNIYMSLGWKLTKFDGTTWNQSTYQNYFGSKLNITSDNDIWIYYGGRILGHLVGNDLVTLDLKEEGIDIISVLKLESMNDETYFGVDDGIVIYSGNSFEHISTANSDIPFGLVEAIDFDSNHNMYFLARGHLIKFDWSKFEEIDFSSFGIQDVYLTYLKIVDDKIYLGNSNVFMIYDGTDLKVYNANEIGSGDQDLFKFIGYSNGNIWIGSYYAGLYKFDGSSFTHYNKDNSILETNYISDLEVDPNGNIWVGTLDGLIRITNDNWQIFKIENSDLICNDINDIDFNSKGDVFILTSYGISIIKDGINVGVQEENIIEKPKEFALKQNYPNPFNPTTKISFMVPNYSHVELNVFNNLGEKIATLVNDFKSIGTYTIDFNAENFSLSSGVYFYTLKIGSDFLTKKMIYLK